MVQDVDGSVTDTAPFSFGHRPADPSWGSALPSLVYYLYRETGDVSIVEEFYPAVKAYVDSLLFAAEQTGVHAMYNSYGDWVNVPGTPKCSQSLTASFSMLENLAQLQALAGVLGGDKATDVTVYGSFLGTMTKAFHASFYANETYDVGVQTCLALPLWAQATPDTLRPSIVKKLVQDLVEANHYHATTGIIGLKYMLEVLSQEGRTDAGVQMLQQRDYPSFGYMIHNEYEPATTIWELWDAPKEGPGMNSRNHVMFGGPVGGWLYKYLGGIRAIAEPSQAGYRGVVIAPPMDPCLSLESTSTSVRTVQGTVTSEWAATSQGLKLGVTVPVGTVAKVVLDGGRFIDSMTVEVDGKDVTKRRVEGVTVETARDNYVVLDVVSGSYDVTVHYSYDADMDCFSSRV
jgi:alpha-L-rhamnosidase